MRQVMVDIETLGVAQDAVILSIGAVDFSFENSDTRQLYVEAGLMDQLCTRSIDKDTVYWWQRQKTQPNLGAEDTLFQALNDLVSWWPMKCGGAWAKDPIFDLAILGHAYKEAGILAPWRYSQTRSVRTMQSLREVEVPESGHDALEDAKIQVEVVKAVWEKL